MRSVFSGHIPDDLNRQLREILARNEFTGRVESTLEKRLGRPIDPAKAELGRLLFPRHSKVVSLFSAIWLLLAFFQWRT
jgi:hypothetical protein